MFEAYVTNLGLYPERGAGAGEYLKFPTTVEEVQALFSRIGIDGKQYEEYFITDYDSDILGLTDHLGEYESLDELNYLAHLLEEMTPDELEKLEAVMDAGEYTGSVRDLINLTQNLDCFDFYSDVNSEEELGRMYIQDFEAMQVPEHLIDYIDYEAYGRDIRINDGGHFAPGGYVADNRSNFVEHYTGLDDIPDEYRISKVHARDEKEETHSIPFALRRLSDRLCLENGLSIVENPKPRSKGKFRNYGEWQAGQKKPLTYQDRLRTAIDTALAKKPADFPAFLSLMEQAGYEVKQRRGAISFRAPGQERFTRLRSDTLGEGYSETDIRAALSGSRQRPGQPRQKINLAIDIQSRLQGKGPSYERWAKVFNLKQMAAALAYLQDNGLTDYEASTLPICLKKTTVALPPV